MSVFETTSQIVDPSRSPLLRAFNDFTAWYVSSRLSSHEESQRGVKESNVKTSIEGRARWKIPEVLSRWEKINEVLTCQTIHRHGQQRAASLQLSQPRLMDARSQQQKLRCTKARQPALALLIQACLPLSLHLSFDRSSTDRLAGPSCSRLLSGAKKATAETSDSQIFFGLPFVGEWVSVSSPELAARPRPAALPRRPHAGWPAWCLN